MSSRLDRFPLALRPIIEQGFLDREFAPMLASRCGFRAVADRETLAVSIGETVTKARPGARPGSVETYTVTIGHYAAPADLNVVTSRVGIASQLLLNAAINGEQAARALHELASDALFRAVLADPSAIVRPNGRAETAELTAGDTLTPAALLSAVARLLDRGVPMIDGLYNCYLDPTSARQLFTHDEFRALHSDANASTRFVRGGMACDFLGVRLLPTSEAFAETADWISPTARVHRPIIVGKGALIEGAFPYPDALDVAPADSLISVVDGVCMVTREPLDRLQQIIGQSWYWIGGFAAPRDADGSFKRAVAIEHVAM